MMASGTTPYSSKMTNHTPDPEQRNVERRKQVYVGELPPTFLRMDYSTAIPSSHQQQQLSVDEQTAWALQQQLMPVHRAPIQQLNAVGRLSITVVQAKLTKNYGMTRMDPYARVRVGHNIYETHTDSNGAKNPHWNKVMQCYLPKGVNIIYLEIYDECAFTMDELIAWAYITIPEAALKGDTLDDWYPLSGKQGEEKEGMINLVLSYAPTAQPAMTSNVMVMSSPYGQVASLPVTYQQQPAMFAPPGVQQPAMFAPPGVQQQLPPVQQLQQPQPIPELTEEEIKQIQEMFPSADADTIKTVYEANRGNKDATVNSLLQIVTEN